MGAVRPLEWPHGVGGGVKSPQGADIPGVDEEPRGDKTPGGPTATEVGSGEDGWERGGGDINPPTARATRTQGANGGEGGPMGGLRTAEPPVTETETVADNGSKGPLTR